MWRSKNKKDGIRRHIIKSDGVFYRKIDAAKYIEREYGYIRDWKNLRREPHGWRMPLPVRVRIEAVP